MPQINADGRGSQHTGLHVEILEMGDLERLLRDVREQDVAAKRAQVNTMFQISGDSPHEPLARAPSVEQME